MHHDTEVPDHVTALLERAIDIQTEHPDDSLPTLNRVIDVINT